MNDLERQRLRRRLASSIEEIDRMKAQLHEVRQACEELAAAMRQIREESQQAMERQQRRRQIRRVV